jgi:hypothetical protein
MQATNFQAHLPHALKEVASAFRERLTCDQLATVTIVLQMLYNLEVGRSALFCGESVFTGFLRCRPGPLFWTVFSLLLSLGVILPGLAFHAATVAST